MSDHMHSALRLARRNLPSFIALAVMLAPGCQSDQAVNKPPPASGSPTETNQQRELSLTGGDERAADRRKMVDAQMRRRDITDHRVLAVMERVPRHLFVPLRLRHAAYDDGPLPIGHEQTISQPYIVALMTQLAAPAAGAKALDIGTGSGYQAAVLAELCERVYSIEIVEALANEARERIAKLGYQNVEVRHGDGYQGWLEHAPFDVIILAAAPDHVPQPLIDQLAPNGRLVLPVGNDLLVIEKTLGGEIRRRTVTRVAFVPMTGAAVKQNLSPP